MGFDPDKFKSVYRATDKIIGAQRAFKIKEHQVNMFSSIASDKKTNRTMETQADSHQDLRLNFKYSLRTEESTGGFKGGDTSPRVQFEKLKTQETEDPQISLTNKKSLSFMVRSSSGILKTTSDTGSLAVYSKKVGSGSFKKKFDSSYCPKVITSKECKQV